MNKSVVGTLVFLGLIGYGSGFYMSKNPGFKLEGYAFNSLDVFFLTTIVLFIVGIMSVGLIKAENRIPTERGSIIAGSVALSVLAVMFIGFIYGIVNWS